MTAMREVQRRRLIIKARSVAEPKAAAGIFKLLDRRRKTLNRELRRSNLRKRLHKSLRDNGTLFKQDGAEEESWQEWIAAFTAGLQEALTPVVTDLYDVETKYWETRQLRPDQVDPQRIFDAYQARTGKQIKGIGDDTQSDVLKAIADWYNTDAGLPELIDDLGQYFDEDRAALIAKTESKYISSQVALDMMNQFEIQKWNWDLAGNPCDICVAKARGNPYNVGDPMPPDDSHPGCECGVVYANEDGSELIYGADL